MVVSRFLPAVDSASRLVRSLLDKSVLDTLVGKIKHLLC
jgi:hypothetical protein